MRLDEKESENSQDISNLFADLFHDFISSIPKLFEAVENEKIFLQIKNRITPMQHGFFKDRSTGTYL